MDARFFCLVFVLENASLETMGGMPARNSIGCERKQGQENVAREFVKVIVILRLPASNELVKSAQRYLQSMCA